jgi:hypothetical protein
MNVKLAAISNRFRFTAESLRERGALASALSMDADIYPYTHPDIYPYTHPDIYPYTHANTHANTEDHAEARS